MLPQHHRQITVHYHAMLTGFLVATIALAFSTLEKTEVWPNRSRLVATFKAPFFIEQKVKQFCSKLLLDSCHTAKPVGEASLS